MIQKEEQKIKSHCSFNPEKSGYKMIFEKKKKAAKGVDKFIKRQKEGQQIKILKKKIMEPSNY